MVMRYFGDTKLSTDGAFGNKKPYPQPFKGKKFKGKGGSAIRIDFTGRKGDLFSAWYMPPKGVIHFREYRVMSEKAFDVFEIWKNCVLCEHVAMQRVPLECFAIQCFQIECFAINAMSRWSCRCQNNDNEQFL